VEKKTIVDHIFSVTIVFFTISIIKIFTRGVNMSFGGVPQWFFILAVAFAICFILYAEWNSRK
jgi:uncharacterized membrane protein YhdT